MSKEGGIVRMSYIKDLAIRLKAARPAISIASSEQKNKLLEEMARALLEDEGRVIEANWEDMDHAFKNGVPEIMRDRLMLDSRRIGAMVAGIRKVAALEDPIGEVISGRTLANGIKLSSVRVPMGCVGIIYESRPNVTADAAALCIKAGNAVLLRGGKEAIRTNTAIATALRRGIARCGLPEDILILVQDITRESANQMMTLVGYLDLLIPRGGAGLIRSVVENATVPVIETGIGNCHIYIDSNAELLMGVDILFNAKCSRPSVCNSCESLLVHKSVAREFLPLAAQRLLVKNVKLLGCERTIEILGSAVAKASEEDYAKEFLDYTLSIKVVDSLSEAIAWIAKYSTGHSEAIVTNDMNAATCFCNEVDAAAVYVNSSTRFTDGEEFGLGAEIGISTQKLHARGPMGLKALTTSKYIAIGNGQIR